MVSARSGRFVEITRESGVDFVHDGDGDPDVYLTNYGPNAFYESLGDGSFRDATAAAGVGEVKWLERRLGKGA